jgi:dTDP-L-rhamnose 4-epimerase
MSTTLVTGGAGFIGTRLARRLAGTCDLVIGDYLHPQVHADASAVDDLPPGTIWHPVDVTHFESVLSLINRYRPSTIVHLAAETGTGQSLLESTRHTTVNVVGTSHVLDACSRIGHVPDRIVLTSSRAVYGEGEWVTDTGRRFYPGQRRTDDLAAGRWNPQSPDGSPARAVAHDASATEPRPANVYAATKLAQEHIIETWCRAMGTTPRILRLQNVYGAGQSPTNSYTGVLTFFAVQAVAGNVIDVYEDGDIIRDFVHVSDVAREIEAAISDHGPERRDVGSGVASTILEAAQIIAAAAGAPEPQISGRYRLGDVRAASTIPTSADRLPLVDGLTELVQHLAARSRSDDGTPA